MGKVAIDGDLDTLVEHLGKLRDATPIEDPSYAAVEKQYRLASDLLEGAVEKEIDRADQDYLDFSRELSVAITALKDALEQIKKIAGAIEKVAKVLDIAGKVVAKLVAV